MKIRLSMKLIPVVTLERLKEVLHFDPNTGIFTWKIATRKLCNKIGERAGYKEKAGYIRITIDRNAYSAHRLAWFYMYGEWPENLIDHINCDKSDNKINNLRDVTGSVNMQNQKICQKGSSHGFLGVSRGYNRFQARIALNKKRINIGSFSTAHDAHMAYLEAKRKYHEGCTI